MSATITETVIPAGTWSIDGAHSRVGFSVKHLGIATVRGTFDAFEGSLVIDGDLSSAKITATIDTASVNTRDEQRDTHLRSADFFDAEQFPKLVFESTAVRPTDSSRFTVEGTLSLHGVTHPVELTAIIDGFETDPWGNERVGLELTGEIDRSEYGITFNQALGTGNYLVSDRVKLSLDVSAIRKA